MNRDESVARELASGPRFYRIQDFTAIYPSESTGGTWVAANDRGLVLALLNRNGRNGLTKARSRGALIPTLIAARSLEEIEGRLQLSGALGMLPFTLVCFDPLGHSAMEATWSGETFDVSNVLWESRHWFSSSLSDANATALRGRTCAIFHEHFAPSVENLRELHRSHSPGPGAYSICVHRENVASVSYSEIVVDREQVRFAYSPGAPCRRESLQALRLDLRTEVRLPAERVPMKPFTHARLS